jgi:mRNA-degrading endonuclease toxin of MazEF toxin-antitoxin module
VVVVRHGEVVLAHLDPTLGVEIKKTRPVIVLSNDPRRPRRQGLAV